MLPLRRPLTALLPMVLCHVVSFISVAGLTAVAVTSEAYATSYHIQTRTAARATQYLRSETQWAAPRVFSQSLTLSAYDLRDNRTGDLNARISLRYATDLGLAREFRQDPRFDSRFNDLRLDLAYVEWRPLANLEMTAGRQWHRSPLGLTDFDGLAMRWEDTSGTTRPFATVAAGRDVQRGLTPWDPGAWDVQGLPPNESAVVDDPWHLMAAATAGLASADRRHRTEFGARHHRRPRADDAGDDAVTHHAGATATVSPMDSLTVTTTASVHTLTRGFDRARVDAAYRIGQGVVATGVDHRRPVFDASSIFNLFGAQPHRSAFATYRRPFRSIASSFEFRAWTRMYFDDDASFFATGDEQAIGGAIAGHHRLDLFVPIDASWHKSVQTLTGGAGGEQYLFRSRLRAPGPVDGLFITGRGLLLWAVPDHHRRDGGVAGAMTVGAEFEVGELGDLGINLETRTGPRTPTNTAAFALFELESWR